MPDPGPRRILVIGCQLIGDAVLSLLAVIALGKRYPGARIDVVAPATVRDVYTNPACVTGFVPYRHSDPFTAQRRVARELRSARYDAALLLGSSFHAALLARLARVPVRAGMTGDYRSWLLTRRVTLNMSTMHQREVNTALARLLNADPDPATVCLVPPADARVRVAHRLATAGLIAGEYLVLNPTASDPKKVWPRFAEWLAGHLTRRGTPVILVGRPADRAACRELAERAADPRVHDWCGELTLRETMALLAEARLYLGNNSGIMHVAAAVGCRVRCVSGHSNLVLNRPWSDDAATVATAIYCRPCPVRVLRRCPHVACLGSISAEDVDKLIDGTASFLVPCTESLLPARERPRQRRFAAETSA